MPSIRTSILSVAVALVLRGSSPVFGQASGDSPGSSNDTDNDVRIAQVVIDGKTLFSVRGVTAHPAEGRARQIEDRIRAIAANSKIGAKSLSLAEHPGAT